MIDTTLIERANSIIESDGKSCSFDAEVIAPLSVYRYWDGAVAMENIKSHEMN